MVPLDIINWELNVGAMADIGSDSLREVFVKGKLPYNFLMGITLILKMVPFQSINWELILGVLGNFGT